jgi:hypothetical protein
MLSFVPLSASGLGLARLILHETGTSGCRSSIFLSNSGGIPMVVSLTLRYGDGSSERVKLAAEIWKVGPHVRLDRNTTRDLEAVEIDAAHNLPDGRRANNAWTRRAPNGRGTRHEH